MKELKSYYTEKIIIITIISISVISSILSSYKSNIDYYSENFTTTTFFVFIIILILAFLTIKNNRSLLAIAVIFFLDIPFIIKENIQRVLVSLEITSNLFLNHLITFTFLGVILILLYLISYIKKKHAMCFFLMFYSLDLMSNLVKSPVRFENVININYELKTISKNYYFLLFDEYPSEDVLKKYFEVNSRQLLSSILEKKQFKNNKNIYSNFYNTEKSIASFLTASSLKDYSFNDAIRALDQNVFSKRKNYEFYCFSIFDKINRRNSLITNGFIKGNNSLLNRYIIPYFLHLIIKRGAGRFTDYEDYHKDIYIQLEKISKTKIKKIMLFHFLTPHTYPLIEHKTLEDRIENANYWIEKSIKTIEKNDPNAGVVIFSDHGLRESRIRVIEWRKNILFYKNINLDTSLTNRDGLKSIFKSITY